MMRFLLAWALTTFPVSSAQTCPDSIALARDARRAILEARAEDGERLLAEARQALRCGPAPTAEQLAEYWMTDGALRFFVDEDQPNAILSFEAAGRIAPDAWDPALGSRLHAWFLQGAEVRTTATLALDPPLPRGYRLRLDASPASAPAQVSSGHHHLVIVDRKGAQHQDWILSILPDTTETLPLDPLPRQRAPGFLIAAGTSAIAAGGFAAGALLLGREFEAIAAQDGVEALDRAYRRQVVYGTASYTLMGLSAAGLTLYFVR